MADTTILGAMTRPVRRIVAGIELESDNAAQIWVEHNIAISPGAIARQSALDLRFVYALRTVAVGFTELGGCIRDLGAVIPLNLTKMWRARGLCRAAR